LSNLLRTPDEVKDIAKLPILGVIPFNVDLDSDIALDGVLEVVPFNRSLIENETTNIIEKLAKNINFRFWINRSPKNLDPQSSSMQSYYITSIFLEAF